MCMETVVEWCQDEESGERLYRKKWQSILFNGSSLQRKESLLSTACWGDTQTELGGCLTVDNGSTVFSIRVWVALFCPVTKAQPKANLMFMEEICTMNREL